MALFYSKGKSSTEAARCDKNSGEVTPSRVLKNFAHLLKGRGASAILTLLATAIAARALAPAEFGLVVVIHVYLLTLRGLVNIKPFEAIIRYGVEAQELNRNERIQQLLCITFTLDWVFAFCGTAIAVALAPLAASWFNWGQNAASLAMVYSLLLLTSATGTASGVLRMYNRFDLLGTRQAIGSLVQLGAVICVWGMDGDYRWFLAAYGLGWATENLMMLSFGYAEYRRHFKASFWPGPVWRHHRQRFPGLWRFLHVVYWQSNLDLIPRKAAVLGVSAFLGPTAAGLFRIAQQFAKVLTVPALLLRQVLFPDLVRLWHRQDSQFSSLVRHILWLALAFGASMALLSLAVGEAVIRMTLGSEYLGAMTVLLWLMLSAGMELGVSGLRAASYAMDLASQLLRIYLLSLPIYVLLFAWWTQVLGLMGAGLATAAWSLLNLIAICAMIHRRLPAI